MHGQIHDALKFLVVNQASEQVWQKILAATQNLSESSHIDDSTFLQVLSKTAEVLGLTLDETLYQYGLYWTKYNLESGYPLLLKALGPNLRSFVENVDTLHTLLDGEIAAPMYRVEPLTDGNLHLHYFSYRPEAFHQVVMGVIEGAAKHMFNCKADMSLLGTDKFQGSGDETMHHATILINLPPDEKIYKTMQQTLHWMRDTVIGVEDAADDLPAAVNDDGSTIVTVKQFSLIWPYHVIIDKNMIIKQVGTILSATCPSIRLGQDMSTVCEMIMPRVPYVFDQWLNYINNTFNMRVLDKEGSSPILLKGQMIPIDNHHLLYMISPKMKNLADCVEKQLYLGNVPIYDTTRQYVFLNQVRNAEIGVSSRLEETTMELQSTADAVEEEQAKMDMLLHELLPKKVADALKKNVKVEAEKFDIVSIVFSDIVTFTVIASSCTPMQVVKLLGELYEKFDALCDKYMLYKVETIGDAYMVVGGVPDHKPTHYVDCANFALELTVAASTVASPLDGSPIRIRVGMHSGPVVAGVVGEKMPRYCLFGDSVRYAESMESHSEGGKVHVSPTAYEGLQKEGGYEFEDRGLIEIKGRGELHTYFLTKRK